MIGYRFLSPALEEAGEAAEYYDETNSRLAQEFLDELENKIKMLRSFPLTGSLAGDGLRTSGLSRFPFNIVYYLHQETLVIVAISHQSRRPDYWVNRLQ